ncbi:MAG TPA: hypothetical protein VF961_07370 [Pyrinomonadaceae bacterium]
MKRLYLLRAPAGIFFLLIFFVTVNAQRTLTGQILTRAPAGNQPRFNVKLYPPKTSRRPILVTSSDSFGKFKFIVAPDSYLLELYLGNSLVYQEVIKLDSDLNRKIDLRNRQTVSRSRSPS